MNARNDEPKAVLGNMSGGTSSTVSAAVELALQRAMETSRAVGREMPRLEELLLALLDDESVKRMLANQSVDTEVVRTSLLRRIEAAGAGGESADAPSIDPALQNVMRRATVKSLVSNKREVEPTDIVVAIVVEDSGHAARVLAEQGLTVDEAESEALNHYLARQAEQTRRLEELRARMAEENARQLHIASAVDTGTPTQLRRYALRLTADDSEREIRFKAAVSHDGRLDLYIESTPFEIEFVASRVAALFEAIDSDGRLKVQLITEIGGQRRIVSGFGGRAGVIFDEQDDLAGQRSGTL